MTTAKGHHEGCDGTLHEVKRTVGPKSHRINIWEECKCRVHGAIHWGDQVTIEYFEECQ